MKQWEEELYSKISAAAWTTIGPAWEGEFDRLPGSVKSRAACEWLVAADLSGLSDVLPACWVAGVSFFTFGSVVALIYDDFSARWSLERYLRSAMFGAAHDDAFRSEALTKAQEAEWMFLWVEQDYAAIAAFWQGVLYRYAEPYLRKLVQDGWNEATGNVGEPYDV